MLILIAATAGWWYFSAARKLSDEQVKDFYRNLEIATLERKPEALCALLADDFESTGTMTVGGQSQIQTGVQNKAQTCEAYQKLYASWDKLGEKMGGILQLDSKYTIHNISISADSKTAIVDMSSSLDVGGSIMNISARSTDTLIRKNGKVLMLHSEGNGSIGGG